MTKRSEYIVLKVKDLTDYLSHYQQKILLDIMEDLPKRYYNVTVVEYTTLERNYAVSSIESQVDSHQPWQEGEMAL